MLAAAMALSLAACKDDSNDSGTITISGEAMNPVFTSAGGTYTVEFTADNEWRVAVPNTNHYTWSSVTPTSGGAGKNQVIVTALRNPGYDGREYSFDLRCGLDSKTIKVTQKQLNSITSRRDHSTFLRREAPSTSRSCPTSTSTTRSPMMPRNGSPLSRPRVLLRTR